MSYKLLIGPQVREHQATLGLHHRRAVKLAIRNLADERGDIIALRDKLAGFHRLRAGPYRLIFRYAPDRTIQCIYLNERSLVYEIFEAEMSRIMGGK